VSANPHALLLDRGNLKRRNRFNRLVNVVSTVAALLAVGVLVIVVGSVLLKGVGALSWHFLTTPTGLFGDTSGGISNAIVGSVELQGLHALYHIHIS
jgi:phosphate transport system permease protein